ncbi:peroxiredoxin family protein [Sphaerisporangium perillae]|uniref:peroxiredoxin family protein n=1 Tax=Sphaerisporangium perillae TaxID=2935860 RepID=UPI00200C2892|nr:TlpA disulfide reductase family protein [Sphaerisporangium perillae]
MLELAVWGLRLVVAAVFAGAAWGKLADREAARQALREFGVPGGLVGAAWWVLPGIEVVVAAAVLPSATAVAASAAALLLLAGFSTAVAVQLRSGRHPSCGCFGADSRPISGWTLARNAGLGVLVAAALWGSTAHPGLPEALPADDAVGLAIAVTLAAVQARQMAEIRTLRRELHQQAARSPAEGLPVGTSAPDFDLPGLDEARTTLKDLLAAGRPVMLVFIHPECGPCQLLTPDLAHWQHSTDLTVIPVSSGDLEANLAWARQHRLDRMLVQDGHEVATGYRLRGTPTAVLIDRRGWIAAPPAGGAQSIRHLLAEHTRDLTHT